MTAAVDITEEAFKAEVLQLAQIMGWLRAHFRPARTNHGWRTPVEADGKGFPDLVLVRDRVIYAELKTDTGRLTDDQIAWLGALRAAGAETYLWRPRDLQDIAHTLRRR
jgi:hypothetical protein